MIAGGIPAAEGNAVNDPIETCIAAGREYARTMRETRGREAELTAAKRQAKAAAALKRAALAAFGEDE